MCDGRGRRVISHPHHAEPGGPSRLFFLPRKGAPCFVQWGGRGGRSRFTVGRLGRGSRPMVTKRAIVREALGPNVKRVRVRPDRGWPVSAAGLVVRREKGWPSGEDIAVLSANLSCRSLQIWGSRLFHAKHVECCCAAARQGWTRLDEMHVRQSLGRCESLKR